MSQHLPDFLQMSNLTAEFYAFLDERDYAGALGCFAADGVWFRRGAAVEGHRAIQAALAARPASFHTAHVVTNVRVQQAGPARGSVFFYLTGHPYTGDIPEGSHVGLPPAHILASYRDTMVKQDGRWLIAEKKMLRTAYKDDQVLP